MFLPCLDAGGCKRMQEGTGSSPAIPHQGPQYGGRPAAKRENCTHVSIEPSISIRPSQTPAAWTCRFFQQSTSSAPCGPLCRVNSFGVGMATTFAPRKGSAMTRNWWAGLLEGYEDS
ncbi:hypothetical protein PMIN03_000144 [Paraphaeosphaeria minitans]